MSKRKLDKTDIGEMHCWANSAFHSGFLKVEIDSDHAIELCERALDNGRLTEENAKLRELLSDVMECVNQDLWDTRCDDAKQLLTELKGQNNDK